MNSEKHKIILFDGVCNLCNSSVLFVIKRDNNNVFQFASLQSEFGQLMAKKYTIDISEIDSIILLDDDKFYTKSSAVLRISKFLSGAYPLFYMFIVLPKSLRNWVYDFIAKNRYRWFGKRDSCMIPAKELMHKFL